MARAAAAMRDAVCTAWCGVCACVRRACVLRDGLTLYASMAQPRLGSHVSTSEAQSRRVAPSGSGPSARP
eukprot:1766594-Prymnesium_polylepis.2